MAPSSVYRALNRHRHWAAGSSVSGSWSSVWEQRLGGASWRSIVPPGLDSSANEARPGKGPSHALPGPYRSRRAPGELVGFDCFYIGRLKIGKFEIGKFEIGKFKGVGKVWRVTACDTASSFRLGPGFPGQSESRDLSRVPARGSCRSRASGLASPTRSERHWKRVQG